MSNCWLNSNGTVSRWHKSARDRVWKSDLMFDCSKALRKLFAWDFGVFSTLNSLAILTRNEGSKLPVRSCTFMLYWVLVMGSSGISVGF